ncbi:hypothetical protein [Oleiagrimonas sp. MCCC 1A03011]|uniref:hypothetical protein n=1 Tax=Oleiagrimonas sp. MCCC 1A03011 TaxID=1926883 RepID=UPI001F0C0984|nr:hypothetical protein [Oleiagrimonas sp. MCCC 1A03011]
MSQTFGALTCTQQSLRAAIFLVVTSTRSEMQLLAAALGGLVSVSSFSSTPNRSEASTMGGSTKALNQSQQPHQRYPSASGEPSNISFKADAFGAA